MFKFPYTNFHELNLDWFLEEWKNFKNTFSGATAEARSVPAEESAKVTVTAESGQPWNFKFEIPRGVSIKRSRNEYAISESQETPPVSGWTEFIPPTPQGFYLWTRVTFIYSDDTTSTVYLVNRMGIDGTGSVVSVNGYMPNPDGNVVVPVPAGSNNLPFGISPVASAGTSEAFSRSDHIHPIGTVPVANGGTGAITPEAARANLGIIPAVNPNLLDNGWFTVNQRGITSILSDYGVDRWLGSYSVDSNGLKFRNGDYALQKLDQTVLDKITNKTITFSVKLGNGNVESGSIVFDPTRATNIVETDDLYLVNNNEGGFMISSRRDNLIIQALKLEYGDVSTLAIDHAPDYAVELLKCQRYCMVVGTGDLDQKRPIGFGVSSNAANAFNIFVPLPNVMREAGATTVTRYQSSSFGFVYGGGSYSEITGFSDPKYMGNGVAMVLSGSGSIAAFNGIEWCGAKIIISKDL